MKKFILTAARNAFGKLGLGIVNQKELTRFVDSLDEDDVKIIRAVQPFTLTRPERIYAIIQAVKYVVKNGIEGDIVECGVWRGGSMMAAAMTLQAMGDTSRGLYLYDTFEGMPMPDVHDVDLNGQPATKEFNQLSSSSQSSNWCYASLAEVENNLKSTGYPAENLHFMKGKVEETIPNTLPSGIALLRLDTDWYESTYHELKWLYPRLAYKGVLIVDDYGHWAGARKATDEYFEHNQIGMFLSCTDYSARIGVKTETT